MIYADRLEEHGRPDRAEFLRVPCPLAKLRDWGGLQEAGSGGKANHLVQRSRPVKPSWIAGLRRRGRHPPL